MAVTCTRNVQVIVRCGVITVYYLSVLCSGSDKVPPPLRLETISVRNGPCPVSRKPPPESYVPGDNLTWGSRRNQLRRGHGSPPVLSEVPHELSIPMRTPKSANVPRSNSFRPDSPHHDTLQPGPEDSDRLPSHTGHSPFRTRPPSSIKNPFCP